MVKLPPTHTTNTHTHMHTYNDILSLWFAQDKLYPPSQSISQPQHHRHVGLEILCCGRLSFAFIGYLAGFLASTTR